MRGHFKLTEWPYHVKNLEKCLFLLKKRLVVDVLDVLEVVVLLVDVEDVLEVLLELEVELKVVLKPAVWTTLKLLNTYFRFKIDKNSTFFLQDRLQQAKTAAKRLISSQVTMKWSFLWCYCCYSSCS